MAFFLSLPPRDTHSTTSARHTPPLDSLAEFEVHPPTLRRRVVQAVGQPLLLVALILSLLYAVLALSHLSTLARPTGLYLARIAAAVAVVCFLMASFLAAWPALRRATQPLAALIGLLVLFHSLAQIHLLGEMKYSLSLLPLLVGLACFLVSRVWFGLQTVLTLAAWAVTVVISCSAPDWLHYGLTLFVTLLLALFIHVLRVAGLTRIEKMRLRDTERKADLEAARQALQKERQERRHAEEALREANARIRLLAEGTADFIAQHTAQGAYLFVAESCQTLLGKTPDALRGQMPWDFIHPEDLLSVQEAFLHVRSEGTEQTIRYRLQSQDGKSRTVETRLRPVRDPATGEVVSLTSVTRDISANLEQAAAKHLQEQQWQNLLAHAPVALLTLDRQGQVIRCGGQLLPTFGMSAEALGKNIFTQELTSDEEWLHSLRRALTGETFQTEKTVEEHPLAVQFAPLTDETGAVFGTQAVAWSLAEERQRLSLQTHLQQKEDECRRLTASLEDAEEDLTKEQSERERLESVLQTTEEACRSATERVRQLETALNEATAVADQARAEQQALHSAVEEAEQAFVRSETLRRSLWEILPYTIFQLDGKGLYREYRVAGENPLLFPTPQEKKSAGKGKPNPEPRSSDSGQVSLAYVGQAYQKVGTESWIKHLQEARAMAQNTGEVTTFTYASSVGKQPEQQYEVRLFAQKDGSCLGIIRNQTAWKEAERQAQALQQLHAQAQQQKETLAQQCAELRAACSDWEKRSQQEQLQAQQQIQALRSEAEQKLHKTQAEAEERHHSLATLQQALMTSVSEAALIVTDLQGRITGFGKGAEQLLGYRAEEVLGEPITLFHDEVELVTRGQELSPAKGKSLPSLEALTLPAKRAGQELRTWTLITKEDRRRKVQVLVKPLPNSQQQPAGFLFVGADLSAREALETAVREWEASQKTTVQAALEAIITIDAESRVLEFNPTAERLFGLKRTEALKTKITDWLIPPAQREAHQRGIRYFLATKDGPYLNRKVELTAQRADGSEIPVEMTLYPDLRAGQPPRFTAHLRDLTEQKRLTVLQMEQARIISLVNEVGSHLLGSLPLRDAMQQCAQALVSLFPGAFIRLRLSHQPESMLEVQASSGAVAELMLTQATIGPVLLDRLHQERKLLVSNNVTAEPWWEKKPDQKLEGVQAFYGCPLQSGEQLLGVLALFAPRPLPTPMVELFRSLVQQITLGLARHEALLRQPTVQTVVDTAAAEKHAQAEAALRQEIEKQLATIRTLEEQLRTLQETPPPPPAMQTAPPNLEVERQQYEARLQEAQAAARRSDQARQEFLTTMSQEIRSPLTAILGQTDILLDPHLETTDRLKALKGIKRNSEQLLHVMNDLLDLSRIETGQLQLERLPCSPWQLVQEVLLSLHNAAQEKGVQLSILPSGPLPRQITTDPTRLRQIVHHLVRNALHATAKGQVTVRVGIQSQESDARLQITVEDESGGFTPEELERLFSPLPIFDSAFIRKVGGSGLGLSIAQRLARRLDGDLTAHPQPNQGNLFMLRLPLAPAELDDKQTEEEMTLNTTLFKSLPLPEPKTKLQGRALLIERHKDNQRVMAYFLERLGLSTEIAPTAETALEWLAEEDFDLLLLDLEQPSPELDGPQLARLLRDKNYTQPLLGLLARSHINAEQRALEAGCDGILFKPVEQETWQNTLSRFLKTAPAETTPQQVPPAAPTEPPIISTYQEDNDFMHLVRDYAGSLTGRLAELRAALKVGDMARVIKLGHLLKGSAATYGYPILSVMAGELEQAAYHGGDGPRLNDRLDAIAHTVERIQHAFQKETVLQGR